MRSRLLLAVLALAACDDGTTAADPPDQMPAPDMGVADLGPTLADDPLALNADCDPLVPAGCALPWPSDKYLVEDAERETGYRLEFGQTTLPRNKQGVQMKPDRYSVLDGYGVGVPLMVILPNLDPDQLLWERDIADTIDPDADIVWLEVTDAGTRRVAYYAEPDPFQADPAMRILHVRPAEILKPGTRYVVGFRGLEDVDGERILPSRAFAALRNGTAAETDYPNLGARQARFDRVFSDLEAEGVDPASLQIAWDFTTASSKALHGDMLEIRRAGFEATGPDGPELTFTEVTERSEEESPHIWLDIKGTMRVPHFMEVWGEDQFGRSHWAMHRGADGMPAQDGWRDADIWVRVPHAARNGTPQGLVLYGHGQQGRGSQVRGGDKGPIANNNNLIFIACDMVGMSEAELNVTPSILLDMNLFPWVGDRLHQGLLEHLLLTRGMMHRSENTEAFSSRGIQIDTDRVYYSGISQGGIFGATIMALSQDIERGHLGVPGLHYSTLIGRSRNFQLFGTLLASGYPNRTDQRIAMLTVQQLWNKTDPVSYYRHISAEPFEGDAPRSVLLAPAKGDPQVSPLTVEVATRSNVGVALMAPFDTERQVPLVEMTPFPHAGSGLVLWNYGNAWPAPGAQPPVEDPAGDPHSTPRNDPNHNRQMVHFWETGEIIDVCQGGICGSE